MPDPINLSEQEWKARYGEITDSIREGVASYYSRIEEALQHQYHSIYDLLGISPTSHYASGYLCEELLRRFFRDVMPQRFSIDKGFIHGAFPDTAGNRVTSPEIDILIHEESKYPVIHRVGEFVVVHPESVRVALQVKRTLTPKHLADAISNILKTNAIINMTGKQAHMWGYISCIVSFRQKGIVSSRKRTISKNVVNRINELYKEEYDHDLLPHFITTLGSFNAVRRLDESGEYFTNSYDVFLSRYNNQFFALQHLFLMIGRKIIPEVYLFGRAQAAALPRARLPIAEFTVPFQKPEMV